MGQNGSSIRGCNSKTEFWGHCRRREHFCTGDQWYFWAVVTWLLMLYGTIVAENYHKDVQTKYSFIIA